MITAGKSIEGIRDVLRGLGFIGAGDFVVSIIVLFYHIINQ